MNPDLRTAIFGFGCIASAMAAAAFFDADLLFASAVATVAFFVCFIKAART
jgi:hypothetical protein